MINIVLCQPEIPQNTGNIMRTCVGTNTKIHLIKPLGFKIDDAKLRRSAVDYYDKLYFEVHESLDDFMKKHQGSYFFFTRYGKNNYTEVNYKDIKEDIYLIFGSESYGIDRLFLKNHLDKTLRIPINDKIRSLNLANSVSIALYEVLRQKKFPGLYDEEPTSLKGADYLKNFKE
ncbi:MAG: tRNA (cytidine(34)-2'-O)-methyltransferase [Acholeplasmataceae bacterium]